MISINMLSIADKVKGQGVGSAYIEQVNLVSNGLGTNYKIYINKFKFANIMHYHTIAPHHFIMVPFARTKGVNVGYVHYIPETLERSIQLPILFKKILYKYIISFYKSMDCLVTVNPYFINELVNHGLDRNNITYIPNYVSSKEFYPMDKVNKQVFRDNYGIGKDAFVVLGVGQVQTRKGVIDFIHTAEKLKNITFLWAGGFSFGKITAGYKELKSIIENPPPNVKFLGILDREKMNEIYNISNLLFMPSYQELFPMAILEAFNCRLPILLRDLEIYPNVFFDYYGKGKNNEDFISEIKQLVDDKEYYEVCCDKSWNGHLFYCEKNVLNMWKEFYEKAIKMKCFTKNNQNI